MPTWLLSALAASLLYSGAYLVLLRILVYPRNWLHPPAWLVCGGAIVLGLNAALVVTMSSGSTAASLIVWGTVSTMLAAFIAAPAIEFLPGQTQACVAALAELPPSTGMGLAAAMDYSVVLDTAKMGFTEVRIGVAPAMISVLCLPKMRASDARAAFLRGNRFLASEAERMGIINRAVSAAEIDAVVNEVVGDLVKGSPAALAATKQLLANVPNMTTDDAFAWTAPLSAELFKGDDAKEGMAAFLEKRPASWIPQEHH